MNALGNFCDGDLEGALSEVQGKVREAPANVDQRVYLFQLLCVLGDWERAAKQLEVLRDLDSATLPMVHTYGPAITCEKSRRDVFEGKRAPLIFGDPERWMALLAEALRLGAVGEYAQADALRSEAFELAPAISGSIDGEAFQWIADADPRLGPMIEAVINGSYCWVPFQRVRGIKIEQPADLRDLVWTPAHFVWSNGGEAIALLPARYPGSESEQNTDIRLARMTTWREHSASTSFGLGQRMFATDTGEYPILDVRSVALLRDAPADDIAPTSVSTGTASR